MKLIIAGGRDKNSFTQGELFNLMNKLLNWDRQLTEIVSGNAKGVDRLGEKLADILGVPVRKFAAAWDRDGKAAGPIRNREMAEYADAVALFPGGRGTESMYKEAKKAGIKIFDFR